MNRQQWKIHNRAQRVIAKQAESAFLESLIYGKGAVKVSESTPETSERFLPYIGLPVMVQHKSICT